MAHFRTRPLLSNPRTQVEARPDISPLAGEETVPLYSPSTSEQSKPCNFGGFNHLSRAVFWFLLMLISSHLDSSTASRLHYRDKELTVHGAENVVDRADVAARGDAAAAAATMRPVVRLQRRAGGFGGSGSKSQQPRPDA